VNAALGDFAISQVLDDFKDFGPAREGPVIGTFVFVNGHDELQELVGHLAFFGGFTNFPSTAAWPSAAIQPRAAVDLAPTIHATPSFLF
jgi:hypothetical protein